MFPAIVGDSTLGLLGLYELQPTGLAYHKFYFIWYIWYKSILLNFVSFTINLWYCRVAICDRIKRNESEVGYVFFIDIGKNSVNIPLIYIVLSIVKSFILWNSVTIYDISNCNGVCIKMKHFEVIKKVV